VLLDHDLETTPLEIKIDSEVGSDEQMVVIFHTAQGSTAGVVQISFTSTVQYRLGWCTSSRTDFPKTTTLPSTEEKVFRITLTRTSGVRLKIHCNEEEIVNVLISGTTCSYSSWSTIWSRDVEWIRFNNSDTASDYYRPYTGE
jgi:hypothetical protein